MLTKTIYNKLNTSILGRDCLEVEKDFEGESDLKLFIANELQKLVLADEIFLTGGDDPNK